MPIQSITSPSDIERFIAERIERNRKALIYNLHVVGEQVLNVARTTRSYQDQTGNLRSSVGYVIADNGKILTMSSFDVVKNGKEGSNIGKEYIKDVVSKHPEGVALIVVAGMNYASYVSDRGKDVIDSAELLADKLVPRMLKKLGLK